MKMYYVTYRDSNWGYGSTIVEVNENEKLTPELFMDKVNEYLVNEMHIMKCKFIYGWSLVEN